MKTKIRIIGVACLTGAAGLVTAGSLVLSAPATGVSNQCAAALQAASSATPTPGGTVPAGLASCVPSGQLPTGGIAVDGSVVSGDGIAIHGSTASGCSIAADKSTSSGGNCRPAAAAPAKAVAGNPSFAG